MSEQYHLEPTHDTPFEYDHPVSGPFSDEYFPEERGDAESDSPLAAYHPRAVHDPGLPYRTPNWTDDHSGSKRFGDPGLSPKTISRAATFSAAVPGYTAPPSVSQPTQYKSVSFTDPHLGGYPTDITNPPSYGLAAAGTWTQPSDLDRLRQNEALSRPPPLAPPRYRRLAADGQSGYPSCSLPSGHTNATSRPHDSSRTAGRSKNCEKRSRNGSSEAPFQGLVEPENEQLDPGDGYENHHTEAVSDVSYQDDAQPHRNRLNTSYGTGTRHDPYTVDDESDRNEQ